MCDGQGNAAWLRTRQPALKADWRAKPSPSRTWKKLPTYRSTPALQYTQHCHLTLLAMATDLARALPKPKHASYEDPVPASRGPRVVAASSLEGQVVLKKSSIPPYGSRSSWRPRNQEDFGDGGAYPECGIAQYPLEMGKKKVTAGNALVLKSDKTVADTIARQGHNDSRIVHSSFKDLIPLRARADAGEIELSRPSEEEVEATRKRTEEALQALVSSASAAQKPKTIKKANDEPTYVRYTPHQVLSTDHVDMQ